MWRSETLRRLPLDLLLDEAVSFYRADPLHNATISTSNCCNIDPKSRPLPIHTNTFASESDTPVNKKRKNAQHTKCPCPIVSSRLARCQSATPLFSSTLIPADLPCPIHSPQRRVSFRIVAAVTTARCSGGPSRRVVQVVPPHKLDKLL